jgi:hypothetical protein
LSRDWVPTVYSASRLPAAPFLAFAIADLTH